MAASRKIILHSLNGYRPALDSLVYAWMKEGVKYVGVVGVDASKIEDIINELSVGDGSASYFMLTASHGHDETLEDAVFLAEQLTDEFAGKAVVVEF